ncbi:YopT-type cysteine protease domain-containing protein [Microbulbifer sp. SSSA002]|uniref:YopT-type cysteine protease domain-containing protein n=1 Tax=Microbulbifer sp. SSSA002 TaxID=3243376 RepID=UPI004039E5B8
MAKDFHFWTNGGGRQRDNIDNWLIYNGLTKANEYCTSWADLAVQNLAPIVPGNPPPPANPIPPVNRCLVNAFSRFRETYGYISISSRRSGHAIAVWIADERIPSEVGALFFDPNYGEFRFPSKNDFLNFFDAFYRYAYLSGWQNYSGRWNINAYKVSAW